MTQRSIPGDPIGEDHLVAPAQADEAIQQAHSTEVHDATGEAVPPDPNHGEPEGQQLDEVVTEVPSKHVQGGPWVPVPRTRKIRGLRGARKKILEPKLA